jgi:hypothetical protein
MIKTSVVISYNFVFFYDSIVCSRSRHAQVPVKASDIAAYFNSVKVRESDAIGMIPPHHIVPDLPISAQA